MSIEKNIEKSLEQKTSRHQEQTPIKILHVVGRLEIAGLETWLMRILRRMDRAEFQADVLVHSPEPGAYDTEAQALGCQILYCPFVSRPWVYAAEFKRILREHGPYDIVHSHVHFFSGYVLRIAQTAQVSCRIAHSHNDHSEIERQSGWLRKIYLMLMKHWVKRSATYGLATSAAAAANLFGSSWSKDPRNKVLLCGLDLKLLERIELEQIGAAIGVRSGSPESLRKAWNISPDAFVVGHVGRFEAQKNHRFLVEIAANVMKSRHDVYFVLVGQGSLHSEIAQQVQRLNIDDRIIFVDPQPDIMRLMIGVFDQFLFPSIHEGLGVALLEAQAAGLPCLISTTVPPEAEIIPVLVQRMSLQKSAAEWAGALLTQAQTTNRLSVTETLSLLRESPFDMDRSVLSLAALYRSQGNANINEFLGTL